MSCSYAAPGSRKKHSTVSSSGGTPDDMQNRIDRLEGLVLSLMTSGAPSSGPSGPIAAQRALSMQSSVGSSEYPQDLEIDSEGPTMGEDSETDQVAQSLGVMKVVDNKSTMYYGDAHWAAILSDVCPDCACLTLSHADCDRYPRSRTTSRNIRNKSRNNLRKSRMQRM